MLFYLYGPQNCQYDRSQNRLLKINALIEPMLRAAWSLILVNNLRQSSYLIANLNVLLKIEVLILYSLIICDNLLKPSGNFTYHQV
jgi:hypothetical protein